MKVVVEVHWIWFSGRWCHQLWGAGTHVTIACLQCYSTYHHDGDICPSASQQVTPPPRNSDPAHLSNCIQVTATYQQQVYILRRFTLSLRNTLDLPTYFSWQKVGPI